ncbi:MAG: hypothetical protein ACK4V6_21225 [Microthrixaceae bacterium]
MSAPGPRVLQIIADTDATPTNLAAVALHHGLTTSGFQVRTLALSAGSRPGLEHDVPTMAPSRRSFAARGQFHHEARWSDVVVLHGLRSATVATAPPLRSSHWPVPVIVALWELPTSAPGRVATRILRAADLVVAADEELERFLDDRVGAASHRLVAQVTLADDRRRPDGETWDDVLRSAVR